MKRRKEALREGPLITGPLFDEPMRVETVRRAGEDAWTVGLVGTQSERWLITTCLPVPRSAR